MQEQGLPDHDPAWWQDDDEQPDDFGIACDNRDHEAEEMERKYLAQGATAEEQAAERYQ